MNRPVSDFSRLVQSFFTERLMHQCNASPHTIASYRDTFRLFLFYLRKRLGKSPAQLQLGDLNASCICDFLQDLEEDRNNSARTRNIRLAAIHSFFRYAAFLAPQYSETIQQVLAIPTKRYDRKSIEYLTTDECQALLAAPDLSSWSGRRDRTIILLAIQTGLRVSEITHLCCRDVVFGIGAHVRCYGKGRKERMTPLRKETVSALRSWLKERHGTPSDPVFPNARGGALSSDGIQYILTKHATVARKTCPSLENKRISPHVLRHTTAMDLLQHGVDTSVIALWLGHESVQTTQIYLHASLELKEKAMPATGYQDHPVSRYHPDDDLLAFLKGL